MLKYSVVSHKAPGTQEVKYYAQAASPDPIDINKISEMIAQNCTLTRHDILACLSAFQEQIINALQDGKSVRLGDLGSFRVTMHSIGTQTQEEFTSANVKGLTIRFLPASRLRKAIRIGAAGISLSRMGDPAPAPAKQAGPSSTDGAVNEAPLAEGTEAGSGADPMV